VIRTVAIVDFTSVDRAMADVETRGKRLAPAFRELRKPLRADQRTHARSEQGPDGPWRPRSPFTEGRRRARNKRVRSTKAMTVSRTGKYFRRRATPKRLLGRLPGAIAVTVGALYVRAVSRASWSGVHQHGGEAGHGRKVRIPQRVFLWLSDGLLARARDVLGAYVVKGWKR
jgi:phage gpG-like protein